MWRDQVRYLLLLVCAICLHCQGHAWQQERAGLAPNWKLGKLSRLISEGFLQRQACDLGWAGQPLGSCTVAVMPADSFVVDQQLLA